MKPRTTHSACQTQLNIREIAKPTLHLWEWPFSIQTVTSSETIRTF